MNNKTSVLQSAVTNLIDFKYFTCINMFVACFISVNVHMPKDRVTQTHQGYGFVEFMGEEDADYAIKVSYLNNQHSKRCLYYLVQY